MIRITRKVFSDLAIWMVGFGVVIGVVFPFFVTLMGIPWKMVITPWFFITCMVAGIMVGAVNIALARIVIGRRLKLLSEKMHHVEDNLKEITRTGDMSGCTPERCRVEVDSEDEIGESAQSFNNLVDAFAVSQRAEEAYRSFSEILGSYLDLDELANQALQELLEHMNAGAGAILVEAEGEINVAASHGIRSAKSLIESDHVRRALRTEKRQIVVLPEDVTVEGVLSDFRPREVIVEPILYKHVPLGVIVLASSSGFGEDVRTLLDLFRQGLALALNNSIAHDRLQRLAALDPLTGIYNRRFGMARLHEEFGRAVRQTGPLGVIMYDIDHFKSVNDTYGHLVGDRILRQIVKVTRSILREGDILVRFGGEEFLAILPAASKQDVREAGERLRRIVEDTSVVDGDQIIKVTISVGGTSYPELSVESEQDLVKYADESLYSAKESGRNRVIVG
jgi:two-component system, cell cycle response regulator